MTDFFGHISYLFIFVGMLCLARRSSIGWVLRMVGEAGWGAIGVYLGMTSLWVWAFLFLCMDIRGYLKWREHERHNVDR